MTKENLMISFISTVNALHKNVGQGHDEWKAVFQVICGKIQL